MKAEIPDDDNEPHVTNIIYVPGNILATNFDDFLRSLPSKETITALEDCEIWLINKKDFDKTFLNMKGAQLMMIDFADEIIIRANSRIHDLQILNSRKRIEKFMHKHGSLYNRINKSYIASYLRINRNDLTRVVKQMK